MAILASPPTREIDRLSRTPDQMLTPIERRQSQLLKDARYDLKILLRKRHTVTAYERAERQKERLRALARPLLEILLWTTAERLAVFAIEAIAARIFAAEAPSAALALSGDEVGLGAVAGEGVVREGLAAGAGPVIVREGYTFGIQSLNPVTGDVVAVGRSWKTGERITVEINIDTGVGVATRETGETIPIRQGRVDLSGGAAGAGAKQLPPGGTLQIGKANPAVPITRLPLGPPPEPQTMFIKEPPIPEGFHDVRATPNIRTAAHEPSEVLAQALRLEGDFRPGDGFDAHHIVPVNQAPPELIAKLENAGINLNDSENGVWLPATKDIANQYGRTTHLSQIHAAPEAYIGALNKRLMPLRSEQVAAELARIKRELMSGEFRF